MADAGRHHCPLRERLLEHRVARQVRMRELNALQRSDPVRVGRGRTKEVVSAERPFAPPTGGPLQDEISKRNTQH